MTAGACVSLCLLVLSAAPARASQETKQVQSPIEVREGAAKQACASGQLDEGVRILAQLFAETDDGNYIFNQARCYEQNGRPQEATLRLRYYLRRPDADPEASAWAHRYLAEQEAGQRPPVVVAKPPAEPVRTGRSLRVVGLVSVGFGLAALGAGTYFGLRTSVYEDRANKMMPVTEADFERLNDTHEAGNRAELLQWVLLSVGATTVSTGALLYYFGARTEQRTDTALLVTPLAGNGAAAAFRMRF